MQERKIIIFDTTLRDGERTPGVVIDFEGKLKVAEQLDLLGVDVIEAGFPVRSRKALEGVCGVANKIRRPVVAAMAGANFEDIDVAWEALKEATHPRIHVFLSNSEFDQIYGYNQDQQGVINMIVETVKHAKAYCDDIEFSTMDASRSKGKEKFLFNLIEAAISAGATTVNIPENADFAVNCFVPKEFGRLIRRICNPKNIPNIKKAVVSVHCHNELGMAVGNSMVAIKAGAGQVEGCVNGIGEWSGNTALEAVVMALSVRHDVYRASTNIDTRQIYPTSVLIKEITGILVQPNKAIVGAYAFSHKSGVHQDAFLKNRKTFEIMHPEEVGRKTGSELGLGKTSGKAGAWSIISKLGISIDHEEFLRLYPGIKKCIDERGFVPDEDLIKIVEEVKTQYDL